LTCNHDGIERLIAGGQHSIEIFDEDALAVPPEAEAEAEPIATAYLRASSRLEEPDRIGGRYGQAIPECLGDPML
jgi:hypothetical protein